MGLIFGRIRVDVHGGWLWFYLGSMIGGRGSIVLMVVELEGGILELAKLSGELCRFSMCVKC